MGCDIHIYVEYKERFPGKSGIREWRNGDYYVENRYYDINKSEDENIRVVFWFDN